MTSGAIALGPLASPVLTFAYDAVSNLTSTTDALGQTATYTYDAMNRVLSMTLPDPDGAGSAHAPVTNFSYDALGNRTLVERTFVGSQGTVRQTGFVYDALNRVTSTFVPGPSETDEDRIGRVTLDGGETWIGLESNTAFDSLGNVASPTDLAGRTTDFTYDKVGRAKTKLAPAPILTGNSTVDEAARWRTAYKYNDVGNLTSVVESPNVANPPTGSVRTTTYVYDDLNRKKTVILSAVTTYRNGETSEEPVSPTTEFEYDMVGNLVKVTDALGHVSRSEYDKLNRKVRNFAPDPEAGTNEVSNDANVLVATYVYDAVGNLVESTTGEPTTDPNVLARHMSQTFDALNRRITVTLPDPETGLATGPTTTFEYDAVGNLVTATDALGRETSSEYDALNRLVSVVWAKPAPGQNDPPLGKTRDADGDLRDSEGELYGVAQTTTYDDFGNIATVTDREGRTIQYFYDVLNRKTEQRLPVPDSSVSTTVPITIWEYDDVGDVTLVTAPLGNAVKDFETIKIGGYVNWGT